MNISIVVMKESFSHESSILCGCKEEKRNWRRDKEIKSTTE